MSIIDPSAFAGPSSVLGATLSVEGGLIGPDQVARIVRGEARRQAAADYAIPKGTDIRREAERAYRIASAVWADRGPDLLATVMELLHDAFGFDDLRRVDGVRVDDQAFPIPLRTADGRVPVVVAPAPTDDVPNPIDRAIHETGEGGRYRSPALLLQDALNAADEMLWGIVTDGRRIRLMRDSVRLGRPAYLEADLATILETDDLSAFTGLWLLVHRTRFGRGEAPVAECPLETWMEEAAARGVAARDKLRDNVEAALKALAAGVLADPAVREKAVAGEIAVDDLFAELLRLVYRTIFVLTAEDRGLLHPADADETAKAHYADGYSFARAAERARRRTAWDAHHDGFEAAKIVFRCLAHGERRLALPALGGLFAPGLTPVLDAAKVPNRAWYRALFSLAFLVDGRTGALSRVNWRDMQTEELGSVYESLLELVPRLAEGGTALDFGTGAEARGNARKTTGSYYTPDSLVQALLDTALDPVVEARRRAGGADAILSMTVIDPACGSGHFLLAAARRMAEAVARERARAEGGESFTAASYRHALREVVARTIHGVDVNAFAVELAKVALWIETVDPGKPLGFLDANIRCGNSLLGLFDLAALEAGIPDAAYKPLTGDDKTTAKYYEKRNRDEKRGQGELDFSRGTARLPEAIRRQTALVRAMPEETLEEVEKKRAAFASREASAERWRLKVAADAYVAAFLLPKTGGPPLSRGAAMIPTTAHLAAALSGRLHGQLEGRAVDAAEAAGAFHWPLAFPDVMANGGFDVVVGNPPWEVVQLGETEYFAARAPEIAALAGAARKRAIERLGEAPEGSSERRLFEAFEADKRHFEALNEFARASGRFDLTARGKVNTYGLFAELFARATNGRGRAGVIVPTGIATDATTAPFFGWLVSERRLARLVDFENRKGLFPAVDSRMKFAILTLGRDVREAQFAFFLTDPAGWLDPRRRFSLSPEEIAAINPNTKTAPVFRSRRDAELTAKIYRRVPVLIDETKGDAGNPWGMEFRQGLFNMTSDSGLFRTAEQLAAEGFERDGTDWVRGHGPAGSSSPSSRGASAPSARAAASSPSAQDVSTPPSAQAESSPPSSRADSSSPSLRAGSPPPSSRAGSSSPSSRAGSPPPSLRAGSPPPSLRAEGEAIQSGGHGASGSSSPRSARDDGGGGSQTALDLAGGGAGGVLPLEGRHAPDGPGAEERYVPLYEAKMIHQFDHRWATYDGTTARGEPAGRDATPAEKADPAFEPTPRYWVPAAEVEDRLAARGWHHGWLMGWRDITNATNERTVISATIPLAGCGDKFLLFFIDGPPKRTAALFANLDSLVLDFVARQKLGGTSLKYFTFKQFPPLPPEAYGAAALGFIVPRVLELTYTSHAMAPFARDLGHDGPPFPFSGREGDEDRRARLRAELDGWFAHAYGLTRDELRYILDPADAMGEDYPSETFRVLKENEIRRHGEYRTRRLVLEAYDALATRRAETGLDEVDATLGEGRLAAQ